MLIDFINILEKETDTFLSCWVKQDKTKQFLLQYNLEKDFKSKYGIKILNYYFDVIKNISEIGNCPVIHTMLNDFIEKDIPPHELYNLCTNFKNTLIYFSYKFNKNTLELFNEICYIADNNIEGVMKAYSNLYKEKTTKIKLLEEEIIKNEISMSLSLGEMGELRSKETGEHVVRVSLYSELLSQLYNLSKSEIQLIKNASPLHDLGKLGIPDSVLNKPGKLTIEEFEIMKQHSSLGFEVLNKSNIPLMKYAAIIANEHHEKWNGKGYPNGKKGNEIHISGRIVAISDVFDALGEERVYKKAWSDDKIKKLFTEENGNSFDPNLTKLFLDNFHLFVKIRNNNPSK